MNALDPKDEIFFPIEIMFEILSRLTVAFLTRCKCVCKRWNEIIQDPKFIEMHMLRSKAEFVYLANDTSRILDSRYGLLLEKDISSGKYHVRNPTTKQILHLPDPVEEPLLMMIFSLKTTGSYKLVHIYEIIGDIVSIGFKVVNVEGSDLSWRNISMPYLCEYDRMKQRSLSIALNGRFLYSAVLYNDGLSDSKMHCLDVETEVLRSEPIIVPHSLFSTWNQANIGKWNEELVALLNIVEGDLHVLVLEDPIRGKWAEKKIIIPLTFLKVNPGMKKTLVPYWASHEKIWFLKKDGTYIVYYIALKQAWEARAATPTEKKIICSARCTLVTLKGMQPKKEHDLDNVVEPLKEFYPVT